MATRSVAAENEEATEAWSGVLFERFVEYRGLIVSGLKAHGDAAIALYPPEPGDRVLDIGCGFGDTTQQLAALVGPEGHASGVDVAEPFITASIAEATQEGVENVDTDPDARPGVRCVACTSRRHVPRGPSPSRRSGSCGWPRSSCSRSG